MQYNYYFDICALCILATIAVTSLARRTVPAYRQRAYGLLIVAVFMATVSERVETLLQMRPSTAFWYHPAEMFSGSVYFLAHLASALCYFLYIMSVLDIYVNYKELKSFVTVLLAYSVGAFLVLVNLFYPVLFHYSEDGLYHRDFLIWIYYVLAAYYIAAGLYLMFKYNSYMILKTRVAIASYVFFILSGILIQFFYPTVLIENFCNAVSATLVYITLQNPSEMVDETLNVLNRKAFLEGVDLKIKLKGSHCTIFVTIDNASALSAEIGYAQSMIVIKRIAKYLRGIGFKEFRLQAYAYKYSDYVFAVTVHSEDKAKERKLMEVIAKRLNEPWNCSGMAIKIEGHCFMMRYPENYSTPSELMSKVEIITEDITDNKETIVEVEGVELRKVKKFKDYDLLARNNLDNKTAVIRYQPLVSKIYRINYCADVLFFPLDENNDEVDMRKHIPELKTTQALIDTDEFVYRRACRALSFWNAGDKNGKYRAIVGLSQGEISKNDFIRRIKKILREEKAEASWISLKLSETTLTTMSKVAERNLRLMGDMNSSIIVDKFGSGYGDLDRILSLPVMQVNLDIDVLRAALNSPKMKIVTEGMVNLFHDVSIFVGATEIESPDEKAIAEEIGCDYLMGDYIGKPVKDSSFVKCIDAYFEEG
ncbi:EAL domain-containing protein [Butyrivibrio sp. YAB3001]|uniref:EAL domain-containing protein n=1 Tax=Butyrivibrio sp. YAB3001 TaxID=1520812 RepID=UPI0008F61BB0|nr:EAL domain-containing protein [Butyrivibrio sp. YAB3001]SFB74790.1 EAL domain, c-di-GMP-specific phosphodiesterase class I (or its enzymatically inactive variant) [Butyrivibrio sp. YAB3001]